MKIAVTAESNEGLDSPVCQHFGHAPFFILVEVNEGSVGDGRAIQFFEELGIETATGASGTVREALEHFLGGKLKSAAPCAESVAHGHG